MVKLRFLLFLWAGLMINQEAWSCFGPYIVCYGDSDCCSPLTCAKQSPEAPHKVCWYHNRKRKNRKRKKVDSYHHHKK